jgi:serine phosphatase RsbU (regulator of sigma subunit)
MDVTSEFVAELQRALDEAPPHAVVPVLAGVLEDHLGAKETTLLLADYSESVLERFDSAATIGSGNRPIPLEGTSAGRAYRLQIPVIDEEGPGWTGHFPVSVRSERFGVLMVVLSAPPEPEVAVVLQVVSRTLGYVVASARRYTDVFERVRRSRNLALAAEMQWELLPVLGYVGAEFSLAGALEPAYEVAGDNFDYAVEAEQVWISITDAMGHGLRAAMLASLAVNAIRNKRRGGGGLVEQAALAGHVVGEQFGGADFVAGLLMRIDLHTGRAEAVNAGQGLVWRLRGGDVGRVDLKADPPLGPFPEIRYQVQPVDLAQGDRLVLVSDGVLEAGPVRGDAFGAARLGALLDRVRDRSPLECVRLVVDAVKAYQQGDLRDDATVVCLDWFGPG